VKATTDVIVVGSGPCGSFSAFTLTKLGAKVVVYEEHEKVGVPSHCTGHLSLSGLRRLGLLPLPTKVVENEFRGAVFFSLSGKGFSVRFGSPVTCVVNRELFDRHLAELAVKAGAEYCLGARAESIVSESGVVKGIVASRRGVKETVTSNMVIDAEGVSSVLLKKTGLLRTLNRSMVVNAVEAELDKVEDVNTDTVEIYLGRKYAHGLFAWIVPRRDSSAKVGLAVKTGDPRTHLHQFMHNHPVASKKLRRSKIVKLSVHPIPLGGPIPRTYSNGLLVVGDAASQVKPTTGGGVVVGLLCSRVAGEIAYEAVKNNEFSEAFLSRYESRWKRLVGFDLTAMRHARGLFDCLSDNKIDELISFCARLGINRILEEAGDLDFQGRSLVRMVRHPAVPTVALYFLLSSLTSQYQPL